MHIRSSLSSPHAGAVDCQKSMLGFTQLLSSKLPALMSVIPGMPSPVEATGEPQLGQNPRVTFFPDFAVTV